MTESSLFGELGRDGMTRTAVISPCGRYRYALGRTWDIDLPPFVIVMLNPSTADEKVDDRTVQKCIAFARSKVCGGLLVVNLFAFRATEPADMWAEARRGVDIVGPENDQHIRSIIRRIGPTSPPDAAWSSDPGAGDVVVGWGTPKSERDRPTHEARVRAVLQLIRAENRCAQSIGEQTKDGNPRHPLYLRLASQLRPWPGRSCGRGGCTLLALHLGGCVSGPAGRAVT